MTAILRSAGRPLGVKELMRLGGLHPGRQTEVKRLLRELVRAGELQREGKRFSVGGQPPREQAAAQPEHGRGKVHPGRAPGRGTEGERFVEGTLHVHRDGFGFVHPEGEAAENIYVPAEQAGRALDGDRVLVQIVPGRGGRTAGRLIKVLSRIRRQGVGTYRAQGGRAWVEPNDPSLGVITVPRTQIARDGDVVKVRLGVGRGLVPTDRGLIGEVTGSLGRPGDPSVEVLSIAYGKGFSDEFPGEAMDEADAIPLQVTPEEAGEPGRIDLRAMPLVTIDGEDARDFDDAVYAENTADGWRLVVAIADVTHYVREGTALDAEALHRATSVYLPDRVLPMLPERLSNGICSLVPDQNRLCMVADMQIDRAGKTRAYRVYPGVMRSAARCTYGEVQDVLDGKDVPHRNAFKPHFERLLALSKVLTRMRGDRGAIDFDLPEAKIVLGEDGLPLRMEKRERKTSHRLIEECMLAANEAVAKFFQDKKLPSVYRFHAEPDEEKLATFSALAQAHGFRFTSDGISSKELNDFIQKLEGHPERRALNQLLLRSMMQAVYSAENVGHYGLAAEHYLHFTSPIRRYPDLIVHRLLKAEWARQGKRRSPGELDAETAQLEKVAAQCSERERGAMQVEREVVSFYSTLLMKDRVGEEFEATVSSVTDFGFFVELDAEFVEGLVKAETLGPDSELDPVLHQLVWSSGRKVRVGQQLRVRLVSANVQRRQLDFEVVAFAGESAQPPMEAGGFHGVQLPGLDRIRRERGQQRRPQKEHQRKDHHRKGGPGPRPGGRPQKKGGRGGSRRRR